MKEVKVGQAEYNACGKFVGKLLEEGCQCEAYTSIFAKGRNAATLHYIDNNQIMDDESELILVDAAGRYNGYNADITRTWPIGPKFAPKAREIYQIVLDMQMACLENIRPHVQWEDIHRISTRIGAQGLLDIGVLKGNLEDILASHVFGYFMPHGVGHFLGIDVHDCAGYPKGVERINEPGIRYLRVRRELLEGMVLTVEPGIYFVDDLINDLKKSPVLSSFVDFDRVQEYRCVGGVRIEDNIVVTSNGHLNLTTCPKTVEDIEKLRAMAY
ncbi:putative Xaa-Pro aminopeptidase PEPP [Zancudomyces culisetae]|nr:putative Xaa-Pro aminopeptidase PEPP [Zancudomyces culisetae]|eukprot:OMH84442.1 putative Xaa-Pro aminopeptidase PEPP [Zancudomyces culisetae]